MIQLAITAHYVEVHSKHMKQSSAYTIYAAQIFRGIEQRRARRDTRRSVAVLEPLKDMAAIDSPKKSFWKKSGTGKIPGR